MRSRPKVAVSWLVVVLGFVVGIFLLAGFGSESIPSSEHTPGWYLAWLGFFGTGLLSLGFLIGSTVALRNPGRAGIIFLGFIPVTAFCLAYPDSGYLVWRSDGGWYETPLPWTAIGLTALFFFPFVAPLFTLRHKTRAVLLFAAAALVAVPVFLRSRWSPVLIRQLVVCSAPFLLFGLFWLGTEKRGWPALLPRRSRAVLGRIAAFAAACLAIACLGIALTFVSSALRSPLFGGDCGWGPPLTRQVSSRHAVFTARVVLVGRSLRSLGDLDGNRHDPRVGEWAIGVVQQKFWGLPWWDSHFVLLRDYLFWKGETYFIDGARGEGLLTRALPIVGAGAFCSRSRPVQDALIDLRVLHESPPVGGARLIGAVRQPEVFRGGLVPPPRPSFAAGARIDVTGAAGTKTIATDQTGIYELDGLQPGDYMLRLAVPDNQVEGFFNHTTSTVKVHVGSDQTVEHNFELFWNGRIEGRVLDDLGKAAHAWVMLVSADGRQLPGNVNSFLQTATDGSYQVQTIPPGSYIVMVDPDGPNEGWPHNLQYYPSAARAQDAQVLKLGAGQELKGIDFTVLRLTDRTVQVRVTWSNGRAAAGAHIREAYEHTNGYADRRNATWIKDADQSGVAVIHLYGSSRVRVFADLDVGGEKTGRAGTYYSKPVESAASDIPAEVDLVLASSTP
jgi:hypothetical protein